MSTVAKTGVPFLAAQTGAAAPDAARARSPTSTRAVACFIALALLALLPGLALKLGIDPDIVALRVPLEALTTALDDIRFGSGLRFWLGVAGATMMGLLLLYPLRKALAGERLPGHIGTWFNLHLILGLFGPVAVLYHCNFGLGGLDANVALWAMLTVTVSGIAGHFVYRSVSAEFYAGKQQARGQLDAITGCLAGIDAMPATRATLIQDFETLEAELLTPRQGLLANLRARWRLERRRRRLARALAWYVDQAARQLALASADHEQLRIVIGRHFGAYMRIARHASSRSALEQVWARWRLFHLPVFMLMIAATALHVIAVWDLDAPAAPSSAAAVAPAPTLKSRAAPALPKTAALGVPDVRRVATLPIALASPQSAHAVPKLVQTPVLAGHRRAAPPELAAAPTKRAEEAKSLPPVADGPNPVAKAMARPASAPPAPTDIQADYAELQRRVEPPPMGLGASKARTLAEQIADYRARRAAGTFAHSESETGFALTGKHLMADCAACHTAPLREARAANPRQCITCHKKDDVHRGRRPLCATCHTPTRWSEIIKH